MVRNNTLLVGALVLAILPPAWAGPISPGQSGNSFTFNFDENGNGVISIDGGPFTANSGSLQPDPSNGGNLALTYLLPASEVPVGNGDVLVLESPGILSDVIRFTNAAGNLTGLSADRMIYYSDLGEAALADTGFPTNVNLSAISVNETGPEGANSFTYGAPNVYNGISDFAVPEPGSLILLVSSVVGLALARMLRRPHVS